MSTSSSLSFTAGKFSASIAALLVALSAQTSHAQTIFAHDQAGNRYAQEAATGSSAPFITTMPADQVAQLGGTARFSVIAGGVGPFTYQWFKDAAPISGATSDVLEIANVSAPDFTPSPTSTAKYSVQVTNAHSTVSSVAAGLYQDSLGAGLPNWWRQQYFGSLAAIDPNADADGDGVTNGQEYLDGSNPSSAASRRAKVTLAGPTSLMSRYPSQETYPGGSIVSVTGSHSGEVQFGGFTGSMRYQGGLGFFLPGTTNSSADVFLRGLFGSMPVQKNATPPKFTFNDGAPSSVTGFATHPSGWWIAWGSFDRVNGQPRTVIARFDESDDLDTGFLPQPNGVITGAATLLDGRFYVSGLFSEIGGQPRDGLARFLADGTLDASFVPGSAGGSSTVTTLAPQRDGKVLLGGSLWDGSTFRPLMRRNANGSIDSSFITTADSPPSVFAQQPDGKILMGGNIATVNGTPTSKLVRLNLDGTLDNTFSLVVANGAVTSEPKRLIVQPDGKILVGGNVQVRLNGSTVNVPLARLNADGTLDSAFTQKVFDLLAGVAFADIALQTDGRIVGVGTFTLSSPSVVNAVRFKADGSVDPDCFVISRPNGPVYAVAAQVNDNLLIGGAFSDVAVSDAPANQNNYFLTPSKTTWSNTERLALAMGGHSVALSSLREQNFLLQTLLPLTPVGSTPVWLGFTDPVESLFHWTSGDPVNFTNWHSGEPNNFNGIEDATAFNYFPSSTGTWVDTPDTEALGGPCYGIIEVDPASLPATTDHWVAGRDLIANIQPGSPATIPNPNAAVPAWSYGYRSTAASTAFTPYTSAQREDTGILQGWNRPTSCVVKVNASGSPGFYNGPRPLHAEEMELHPGSDGTKPVVRWTAPQSGTYIVTGFWQDHDWGGGDGCSPSIVVNGVSVFNDDGSADFDNGNGAFAARVLTLNAGDTVDYVLGHRGGDAYDSTRFNATVTKVQDGLADLFWAGFDLARNEKPDGNAAETSNPNFVAPTWSYGQRTDLISSGLNLYPAASHRNTFTGTATDDAIEGYVDASGLGANTGTTPIAYNYGFGPNLPFNASEMLLYPAGSSGPYPVVRWTAPAAGRYEAIAYWQDSDAHGGNGISAHILVNGAQVYGQDMDNGAGCSVAQSLELKAGDVVDFTIGTRGDFSFDVTKFNAVIVRPAGLSGHGVLPGTLSLASNRADIEANATIDWANAAPNNTDIAGNPFVIESSVGVPYHVRKNITGNFKRLNQSSGWAGNFAPGDAVLNHGNSDGPVIIEAASRGGRFSAIGMQIQPNQNGPFTATIRAYDMNGDLLGTHTVNGTSAATADNSAIFIGVKSTVENIHSISVDTNTTDWGGDFAINRVSIKASNSGAGNELSNLRTNFARLVPTNSTRPFALLPDGYIFTFASGAPASLFVISDVTYDSVNFAAVEVSADGVSYQPLGYGTSTDGEVWSFAVPTIPPGQNYYRATLRNNLREQARTHATILTSPPVVTSALVAIGEVGQPFSYTGTATGALTGFTATSLPAWATASFDANSNTLRITGTPTSGVSSSISLQPANAAGSTTSTLALTITSPFSSWQDANFTPAELLNPAISGPLGDATGAGIPNLIKYALGIPPKQPGNAGLPTGDVQDYGASDYLTLVYTRDKSVQGITFVVEVSDGLTTWDSGPAHTTEVSRVSHPNNTETVTVRDNVPSTTGQQRFMRLKVIQ